MGQNSEVGSNRPWLSNAILCCFLGLVGLTVTLSDALKTPIKSHNEIIEQTQLFSKKEVEDINEIIINNKNGEFKFNKAQNGNWNLTFPKEMQINSNFISKLHRSLGLIKTKNQLPITDENKSKFSLETPPATMTLKSSSDNFTVVKLGIFNTIDNSTYVLLSDRDGILHIEAPSQSLENVKLEDFMNTNVFDLDSSNIILYSLAQNKASQADNVLELKDDKWKNKEDKTIEYKKATAFLDEVLNTQSNNFIESTDNAFFKLQKHFNNPSYTITLKERQKDGEEQTTFKYQIVSLNKELTDAFSNTTGAEYAVLNEHKKRIYLIKKELIETIENKADLVKIE